MKEKQKINETNEQNVAFEEMEQAEEYGASRDFLTGIGIGVGIVAGIVALT